MVVSSNLTAILIAILSPIAVAANGLVLAAIVTNPQLRTHSYLLIGGLALTDFFTGLITQPSFAVASLAKSTFLGDLATVITAGFGSYFACATMLTVSWMSVERWLHMTHRSPATMRHFWKMCVLVSLAPIPYAILHVFEILDGSSGESINTAVATTSVAYFKVFRIIRRHQQQIRDNASQSIGQPTINLIKYKKSVFTILYVIILLYVCYFPVIFCLVAEHFGYLESYSLSHAISLPVFFASSSLNPILYCWRIKDIRDGMKHIVKKLLCY